MMSDRMGRGNTLEQRGRIKLREFPEHLAADIDQPENGSGTGADCYAVFMEYLAGGNSESRTLPMHTPIREVVSADHWQVSEPLTGDTPRRRKLIRFDFPQGPSIGLLPKPDDPRVHLWTVPSFRTATIWFARAPTEARIAKHVTELENFLSLKGVTRVPRGTGANLRTVRRGPFGLLTELSVAVSGWPEAPMRRSHKMLRRGGLPSLPAAS